MERFRVTKGNNMPVQSPLIPDPFVPYQCMNNVTLSAICRAEEQVIKHYLGVTPFQYVTNLFIVTVSDFSNCDKVPFMDTALVFPVKYKDVLGGYYMFEYEDNDASIAAGRELWGYPKKYAAINMNREGDVVTAKVDRKGVNIIEMTCDLSKQADNIPVVNVTPHLNIHTIPMPDGPGIYSQRIIARDTTPDFKQLKRETGQVSVNLNCTSDDPLHEFGPVEVLGATFITGDYYATDENGWGKVIGTII